MSDDTDPDTEWETWRTPAIEGCGLFVFLMAWAAFLAMVAALCL